MLLYIIVQIFEITAFMGARPLSMGAQLPLAPTYSNPGYRSFYTAEPVRSQLGKHGDFTFLSQVFCVKPRGLNPPFVTARGSLSSNREVSHIWVRLSAYPSEALYHYASRDWLATSDAPRVSPLYKYLTVRTASFNYLFSLRSNC